MSATSSGLPLLCVATVFCSLVHAQDANPQPAEWANEATAQRVESILGMQVRGIEGSELGSEGAQNRSPRGAANEEKTQGRLSKFESRLGMLMVIVAGLIAAAAVVSVLLQRLRSRASLSPEPSRDFSESMTYARQQLEAGDFLGALRHAHKAAGRRIAHHGELHYKNVTDGRLSTAIEKARPKRAFESLATLFGHVVYGRRSADAEAATQAMSIADAIVSDLESESPTQETPS